MAELNAFMVRIRGTFKIKGYLVENREEKRVVIAEKGEIEKAITKARAYYKDTQILDILSVEDLGAAVID